MPSDAHPQAPLIAKKRTNMTVRVNIQKTYELADVTKIKTEMQPQKKTIYSTTKNPAGRSRNQKS
jgi:predicted CopG family antitoxin